MGRHTAVTLSPPSQETLTQTEAQRERGSEKKLMAVWYENRRKRKEERKGESRGKWVTRRHGTSRKGQERRDKVKGSEQIHN